MSWLSTSLSTQSLFPSVLAAAPLPLFKEEGGDVSNSVRTVPKSLSALSRSRPRTSTDSVTSVYPRGKLAPIHAPLPLPLPPLPLAKPLPPLPSFSASAASVLIASESCWGFEPEYLRICWLFLYMMNVGVLMGEFVRYPAFCMFV